MEQSITVDVTNGNPPTAQQPSPLMTSLLAVLEEHISNIVITQVTRILTNHTTMRMIDDGFKQHIREVAAEVVETAISDHNDEEYHLSESDIQDRIETEVSAGIENHDFDSQISDAVSSALDQFDFNDIIRSEIRDNITFSVSVD